MQDLSSHQSITNQNNGTINEIVREITTNNILFYDQYRNVWVALDGSETDLIQIGSEEFGYWLGVHILQKHNAVLKNNQLRAVAVKLKKSALQNGAGEKRIEVRLGLGNSDSTNLPAKKADNTNTAYELQYNTVTSSVYLNGVFVAKYRQGSINAAVFNYLYSADYKSGDSIKLSAIKATRRKMPQFKFDSKLDPAIFEAFFRVNGDSFKFFPLISSSQLNPEHKNMLDKALKLAVLYK